MPADPLVAIEPTNFGHMPEFTRTAINRSVSADGKTIAIDVFSNGRASHSDVKSLLSQVRAVATSNAAPGWQVSVGGLAAVYRLPLNSFRQPARWSSLQCSPRSTCCWF